MSGSCLTKALRPEAKVKPILGLTWVWLILGIRYSIGSSIVEILTAGVFKISSIEYKVVVLPQPVGPVIKIIPIGFFRLSLILSKLLSLNPKSSKLRALVVSGKRRITIFSPSKAGRIETRRE